MKKSIVISVAALLLLSGCGTYTGSGAFGGASLGGILGSAIGGIAGGPRGSDIGTVAGVVGGAVIGATMGQSADNKAEQRNEQRHEQIMRHHEDVMEHRHQTRHRPRVSVGDDDSYAYGLNEMDSTRDSGFDPNNGGDDRIYDFNGSDYTGNYSAQKPEVNMPMESSVENLAGNLKYTPSIEIKNARFVDDNEDGQIERGELSKIIFEIYNRGTQPLRDVVPTVIEATGNRHIFISPNMHVEEIMPGKGIRYTAMVKADNRLKNGKAKFCVSVVQGNRNISKVSEFNIPTIK